jgi:hypothetical protein
MTESQDHLGRETGTEAPDAQTVTQFAVQEGNLDADAPGVQDTIDAEQKRAERGTERAQQVSDALNGKDATDEDPDEG